MKRSRSSSRGIQPANRPANLAEDYGRRGDDLAAYDRWEPEDDGYQPPRDYADGCEEQGCPPDTDKSRA